MRGHPGQITEEQAVEVVRQLGAALTELHDLPIGHGQREATQYELVEDRKTSEDLVITMFKQLF